MEKKRRRRIEISMDAMNKAAEAIHELDDKASFEVLDRMEAAQPEFMAAHDSLEKAIGGPEEQFLWVFAVLWGALEQYERMRQVRIKSEWLEEAWRQTQEYLESISGKKDSQEMEAIISNWNSTFPQPGMFAWVYGVIMDDNGEFFEIRGLDARFEAVFYIAAVIRCADRVLNGIRLA